ncbi:ABC transporter permease [Alsobacter soli]|uniref:ABC transporter permease n=1 Tax=Alsobacter soli TaxID=2109933 RepID=A0A2T1HY42_9HYPH|nr:ABC transporter permease [Alsobacter soli]PSC06612.1 ABC transporter permease [Alsobacter soli]
MSAVRRLVHDHWKVVATFAAIFVVWEAAVLLLGVKPYILPKPTTVLAQMSTRMPTIVDGALATLQPMLAGYVLAVAVGVLLALLVAFWQGFRDTLYPVIVFLQIVPKIAVAPLFLIWFGYGLLPKVLLVFLLSFFPIVVSAVTAFRSVDPDILDLARATGAGPGRIFWKVQLPHALPTLFTGFKVAAALSATGALVAEFVASDRGLGYLLVGYSNNMDTPMAFATILVVSLMGLALYGAVEAIERVAIPWHVSRRSAEPELSGNP